ncbi:MdtA/MuxA family multidrug efflux RND transporter periplasmic adaptor subunit [Telmatospirillum sp.]|uniref:MdtA/MuxA family multidrug efflux RND transporter periplasmic adaptor subunit n=1 Tax=Telmatospirillum sp. TaxID=2079197 RepID=UPI0028472086|nr:MdtA/MuxA family multidrug efflux RND transporter periplasmic adaptor subunit [Telmatospirillum sp.]MDR3438655.1 MdtA/MuxA family multidrug efflux RND transporter periplasmic adaptor subunit [Telmatospirillum sp.]
MSSDSDPFSRSDSNRSLMHRRRSIIVSGIVLTAIAAGVLTLTIPHPAAQTGAAGQPGMGTESVAIATAESRDIPIVLSGLGTVTPLATVTVKSQISGYVTQIAFTEGQMVHKGDLLVQIDPRPHQALLDQYEGTLAKDQALLDNARLDLKRYRTLAGQDSISGQSVDTQAAVVRQYEGTVRADRGQVEAEKLNLLYCRITSPVDGRVGLRQVDLGNYVAASDSTGIVVVTEVTPMSVLFVLPEDKVPQVRTRLRTGATLQVIAYDRSNSTKLAEGNLSTLDNQLDTATGTLKLRALFPNKDDSLFPNQFVNARLLLDTVRDAVTIPVAAVQKGADGRSVYVVDNENKVHLRKIETGATDSERVAVTKGLKTGERVVTDGLDRLQDGMVVTIAEARS